jgi:Fe-S cluster biogenesis protein NfuA
MPENSPIAAIDPQDNPPATTEAETEAATEMMTEATAEATAGSVEAAETSGEFYDAVAQVVKVIRPAVQADQGDIFLRGVDQSSGVVSVELVGACVTCPASTQTLKQGLERILKQRIDGVTEVRHVGEELLGADEGTVVSL